MASQLKRNSTSTTGSAIDSLRLAERYFILRNGGDAYYMKNPVLSSDQTSIECTLDTVPFYHQVYLQKGTTGNKKYSQSNVLESSVLNEVHFHIPPDKTALPGPYKLQLDQVQKIEVIEKDRKRTTSSYVIGALGYTLGVLAVVTIIVAATKSSCPFVSAYTNGSFSLQGEIYGGAIYPQMARHDYMPLKMQPLNDGSLQVKISNELHEKQYTDMAELWIVTHDKNSKVLADEKGNLYNVSDPKPATSCLLNRKKDMTAALTNADDNYLMYMDDSTALNATNEATLHFNKPAAAKKGKLILSLKNSYFLDLLYGELAKGFGSYYSTYIIQQRKKPVAELLQWTKDQQIPLEVSVKTISGWKKITDITTIGPLATRQIVVPVDLSENIETFTAIKLSSGFMFWEIDYAAMDFTEDNNFTVQKLAPSEATDELDKNVLPYLAKEDAIYLSQPAIGNVATIVYKASPLTDATKSRTYILHSKGYYEHIRDFKNPPNVAFLNQFKKANAFPMFGVSLYKKMAAQNNLSLTASH
ncbi:hypothetical protein [Ferruginibacter paludis]|uniref:hypothetical protein n=1 Tax=Ferruginibacter paludis TaxID=1310417 RepID=UPI0025B58D8C|nr:hypothetical protein [Ferruginibacter paludis]